MSRHLANLRRLVLTHPKLSLVVLAAVGIALAVVGDNVLRGPIQRYPLTANVAAAILGAPVLLLAALVVSTNSPPPNADAAGFYAMSRN